MGKLSNEKVDGRDHRRRRDDELALTVTRATKRQKKPVFSTNDLLALPTRLFKWLCHKFTRPLFSSVPPSILPAVSSSSSSSSPPQELNLFSYNSRLPRLAAPSPSPQELNLVNKNRDLAGPDHDHGLQPNKYDVFISFRGTDVRDTFLSHLYAHLNDSRKLAVYKDDVDLPRGMKISSTLLQTIERSDVYVVILSPNYMDSSWCLDELVKILECKERYGRRLIPVFYGVEPSDIENQKLPSTTTAGIGKVQSWRAALREIANLSGFDSKVIRPETKLMEEIAEAVFQAIPGGDQDVSSYLSSRGLVGLDYKMLEVERLLCFEGRSGSNRTIIGLWGMAGIGKTLLAKAVFDLFSHRFETSCYFSNFAERVSSAVGMLDGHDLQNYLFSKLLGDDIAGGRLSYSVLRRLRRMKALVVIDDVGDDVGGIGPLRDLLNGQYCDLFGPGSRIIITSRNQQLLNCVCHYVYEVEPLNNGEAFRLFCLHAFKGDSPQSEYLEVALRAVRYASGNPLAITVLGAHLCGRDLEFWDHELNALQDNPMPTVENVLKRSFYGLSRAEKDVFLDLACFYDCLQIRDPVAFEGGRVNLITNLVDKSLLSIDIEGFIEMNGLLIDLGRGIVNEERKIGKHSRLWKAKDIYHLFEENKGTQSIEGIILSGFCDNSHYTYIQTDAFAKMENLRFLVIPGDDACNLILPEGGLKCLPNTLRILDWQSFASKCLPSQFSAEYLVTLDLRNSEIEQLWEDDEFNMDLRNLKFLFLSGSRKLRKLPNLSRAMRLEELYIVDCVSLVELPISIFDLPKLGFFDVSNCSNLKWDNLEDYANSSGVRRSLHSDIKLTLDRTLIQNFPDLFGWLYIVKLQCYDCTKLTEFPVFPSLEELTLTGSLIEEVVELEKLTGLKRLCLSDNEQLVLISGDCSKLKSLTEIELDGCSKLSRLPDSICDLIHLEILDLRCTALTGLPSSIGDLIRLTKLSLSGCKSLASLPDTIHKLPRLDTLDLAGCDRLRHLPELPSSLHKLDAHGCKSLETLSIGIVQKYGLSNIKWCFAQCWKLDPAVCNKLVDKFVKDSVRGFPRFPRSSLLLPAKWGSESGGGEGSTMRCNNSNSYSMVTVKLRGQPWMLKSTIFGALLNTPDPLLNNKDYKFLVECVKLNKEDNVRAGVVVDYCNWKPFGEYEDQKEYLSNCGHLLVWSTTRPLVAEENAGDGSTLEFLFRVTYKYGLDRFEIANLIKNCRVLPVYDDRVVINEDSKSN